MSRVKLSEFRAKRLLSQALGIDYGGVGVELGANDYREAIEQFLEEGLYVVKVDQAVKKRGKNGLIALKRTKKQTVTSLRTFAKQGYSHALVEPYVSHQQTDEHYLALSRTERGVELNYSPKGGIDIESHAASILSTVFSEKGYNPKLNNSGLDDKFLSTLYELFQKMHMTLLEINPLVVQGKKYIPLDAAVEVDSAAQFFVGGQWNGEDIRETKTDLSESERIIGELNAKSPASLSFKVLNPNGSIFLLLSGGGASVVVADELANIRGHTDIANYGEYSGNPSEDETYAYAGEILRMMLKSSAVKKALVIAGGVANFTDVHKTFAGIIRAMRDCADELREQEVKVFVRRGGPNQEKGLKAMKSFLEEIGVSHAVHGPDKSLAQVVAQVAEAAS